MNTSISSIHAKSYPGAVSFKAYDGKSQNVPSKNPYKECDHYTSFFRNWETLEFIKNYVLQEYPKGTHIAGPGAANGNEAYSAMMFLHENNKDKRYTYTGYDVAPEIVELAKSGPFVLKHDLILDHFTWEEDAKLKKLFDTCFEKINLASPDKLSQILGQSLHEAFNPSQHSIYMPKKEFVEGVVDFKPGDVHDISQLVKPDGKTGVVIFKNAWYMVMGIRELKDCKKVIASGGLAPVEKIIEDVHKILPQNGIFVVGNLEADHLYDGTNGSEHLIYQNGKRIKVCDNTPFHDLLRKHGFIPIFYEHIKGRGEFPDRIGVHLPSVWRKI